MFFRPVVIESLHEVQYAFQGEAAREAVSRFRAEQQHLDARWAGSGFPGSSEIASSIQY